MIGCLSDHAVSEITGSAFFIVFAVCATVAWWAYVKYGDGRRR